MRADGFISASSMTILKIGELITENFDRIFRIVTYYVYLVISNVKYSQIFSLATDETSCKRGHKYITIVIDLKKQRVLFVTLGKDHTSIDRFKEFLEEPKGDPDKIIEGCCDMSQSFIKGLTENFPNISIMFDKFHVMKMMNEALNEVRKAEQKENNELIKTRMF
jgi:transposase